MVLVAEEIFQTIEHIKDELRTAVFQHVGYVRALERTSFFPALITGADHMHTMNELAVTVDETIDELEKYAIFDRSLEELCEEVRDLVGEAADRFTSWNFRRTCSAKEAAEMHNRSVSTIYRWIREGRLDATKVNGRWVVDPRKRDPKNDPLIILSAA